MMTLRTLTAVVVLLVLAGAASGQILYPLVTDWQQYFRIDTSPTVERDGRALVNGTVWNTSTYSARKIQLLIEGLDASGQPVTQRVIWLGSDLRSGTHAYFEAKIPPAASYRVSVFAFDSPRGRWG